MESFVYYGRILGRGANWAVAQGPPQLRGLHKKTVKNITQGNIKILFETDNAYFYTFLKFRCRKL